MPGKSSAERQALEAQNARVMAVFEAAGFDHIAPDILQPADIFLERSGEDIRANSYVFTDPEGAEMCLRPDLTVPACRYHLAHAARPDSEARYCYCGPAFRFTKDARLLSEFGQAGIEWLAAGDAQGSEAQVLALTIAAVRAGGLKGFRVKLGDLSLFHALLDGLEMPRRWRRRLIHHFWRPQTFRETLTRFAALEDQTRTSISPFVDKVVGKDIGQTQGWVEAELDRGAIPLAGGRSTEEIATRLVEKAADRSAHPLAPAAVKAIETYLAIEGNAASVLAPLEAIAGGEAYRAALKRFRRRIEAMRERGLAPEDFAFAATFGRNLEYYTGFVFQIEADTAQGPLQVAGGGRYDDLLSDIGSAVPVSAVGCAIGTESLLAAAGARS
ncbi:ATP phosphoribosyltransferase regulatory subunit [Taklimakanibacter lacteus]|uniref:ATP phosphoribosyltransferase regulatory subunit n=1 Tax=Taklimakanibacter lacteus TaxID=2268456 RepID=UPI0013C48ADC